MDWWFRCVPPTSSLLHYIAGTSDQLASVLIIITVLRNYVNHTGQMANLQVMNCQSVVLHASWLVLLPATLGQYADRMKYNAVSSTQVCR